MPASWLPLKQSLGDTKLFSLWESYEKHKRNQGPIKPAVHININNSHALGVILQFFLHVEIHNWFKVFGLASIYNGLCEPQINIIFCKVNTESGGLEKWRNLVIQKLHPSAFVFAEELAVFAEELGKHPIDFWARSHLDAWAQVSLRSVNRSFDQLPRTPQIVAVPWLNLVLAFWSWIKKVTVENEGGYIVWPVAPRLFTFPR